MTRPLPFDVEPWSIGLAGLDPARLPHRESVFALSNGHIGWRGNLDEGQPEGIPGSYLNGLFERYPMPYAESGYGYPETGQNVINAADGKIIRLFVDDEPFDVTRGRVHRHGQRLDFRAGTLHREIDWTSPAGVRVLIASTRLVSLAHRAIAAVRYEVRAVDTDATVTIQSELIANQALPVSHPDERIAEHLAHPLEAVDHFALGSMSTLVHRTRGSALGTAVSMDHTVTHDAAPAPSISTEVAADLARTTVTSRLSPGTGVRVDKFVGHEFGADVPAAVLRDRAEAAVTETRDAGWDALVSAQRERLAEYWDGADVQVDGAPRLQQAVRFALFHLFQGTARAQARGVPGKGLTGAGYQGHTFWDAEAFVLPVLIATAPEAAKQALIWRHATLPHARRRARELGFEGATYAWRTIDGQESSGYWPASTAAFHVNADIAGAVVAYVRATGDEAFEREMGLEILAETARLWVSLGRWDHDGGFHLDGVTGPDEYSALVDDNIYTNVLARLNLKEAADAADRHPETARRLGLDDEEIAGWRRTADAVVLPYDARRQVHAQSAGFTDLRRWDFAGTPPENFPLQAHYPYVDLYRKQVVKQADLVLALLLGHDAFTAEEKRRAFAYYEALTVRDSSLSAAAQACIAAEVGHLDLAADYLGEAATLDLDDLQEDTAEGLHLASLAGIWIALVAGFGGMRVSDAAVRFSPRLPPPVDRLRFVIRIGGRRLRLDVGPTGTEYHLVGGPPLAFHHYDEHIVLHPGASRRLPTPPPPDAGPAPTQPDGRRPRSFAAAFANGAG